MSDMDPTAEELERAARTYGEIDDEEQFMTFFDYVLPDGREFRRPMVSFKKVNPFAGDRGVIETTTGNTPETDLDKRIGADEHQNATTFWARYFDRETGELVREDRNVYVKRTLEMTGTMGSVG